MKITIERSPKVCIKKRVCDLLLGQATLSTAGELRIRLNRDFYLYVTEASDFRIYEIQTSNSEEEVVDFDIHFITKGQTP